MLRFLTNIEMLFKKAGLKLNRTKCFLMVMNGHCTISYPFSTIKNMETRNILMNCNSKRGAGKIKKSVEKYC